ncbi:MAG: hypothetical protein F6K54_34685 [Okeania sp. SIO3B5]|uniref:hypothetical protein n=1 Tax=Okeania sp. SIO3B5 TaxID=2607811 RepID=UPI0013FE705A|nr:hypothetical protein [Okeania sp. SIO3B5]NEO57761.1 hypothetical protein [Okeania sp. SIO3B5]
MEKFTTMSLRLERSGRKQSQRFQLHLGNTALSVVMRYTHRGQDARTTILPKNCGLKPPYYSGTDN